MSSAALLPVRIEMCAPWTGFASPSQVVCQLLLQPEEDGDWAMLDEVSVVKCTVPRHRVARLMASIDDIAAKPEPIRFGRTADELAWHFSSCTTDDSPTMLVELHFDGRDVLRMTTSSNHAHLLPWTIESNDCNELTIIGQFNLHNRADQTCRSTAGFNAPKDSSSTSGTLMLRMAASGLESLIYDQVSYTIRPCRCAREMRSLA